MFASTAGAVVPRTTTRVAADTLTAMPAAGLVRPLRAHRQVRFAERTSVPWQRFAASAGPGWRAAWDSATGVPNRLWGPGIAAPGAVASPEIAEQLARRMLADHLALLAPGAALGDFTLVSNTSDGDIRAVGFVQRAGTRLVVGGQISFRFKRDRLFMIGSEALPDVVVRQVRAKLAPAQLRAQAADRLRRELALPDAPASVAGDEVVLPLVGDDAVLGYRVAVPMMIDGGADGRYLAYVDPASGEPLAVHQQNLYATGTVMYRGVDRHPANGRKDRAVPNTFVSLNDEAQTTTATGGVTWSSDTPQIVTTSVAGQLVRVVNRALGGAQATAQLPLSPGGSVMWDASASIENDAQVATYLATIAVKEFVRDHLDPNMPKLDEAITANVNIRQNCNAFFDGKAINFFIHSDRCQNTGRLEDVIYHEFGHALHVAEIIKGVGGFDSAMSEGVADFLAAQLTNDSGMGRGFFYSSEPLRELDPPDREHVWPNDISEIHQTGLIFGGAFWDLRERLIDELGPAAAQELVGRLYIGAVRRSTDIPSSLLETLATDDDDGDLTNGTPHECAIREAFARHGLRTATGTIVAPGALDANALSTLIRVDLTGLTDRCAGDDIDRVTLTWMPDSGTVPAGGTAAMTQVDRTRYWAQLPLALEGSVRYAATVTFKDGSGLVLADNRGDPYYTIYQGHTVPLFCTGFETDPFLDGWTTGTGDDSASPWQWGSPVAGAGTDPPAAYAGERILAQRLDGNYAAGAFSYVRSPDIEFGQWSDVRLQYRRWLAVEDSEFDQAELMVNDERAWINVSADIGNSSSTHHIDREWRFHDVQLSRLVHGHTLSVGFELRADQGLEFGGWSLDDLCVVANVSSVCGDGVVSPTEDCDDGPGNADAANRCRTWCHAPTCGDGIVDDGEDCDGSKDCNTVCTSVESGCSSGGGGGGWLALGALTGVLALRRRRRV